MNEKSKSLYSGFAYKAEELSAFTFSIDTFIISLKIGSIISHVPDDPNHFKEWLLTNKVRDINTPILGVDSTNPNPPIL